VAGQYDTGGYDHGFLLSGGIFTAIDYPGAISTPAFGIKNRPTSRSRRNCLRVMHAGSWTSRGAFSSIDVPTSLQTVVWRINNDGVVVGNYQDSSLHGKGLLLGTRTYTSSACSGGIDTYATALNDGEGVLGLGYYTSSNCSSFLKSGYRILPLSLCSQIKSRQAELTPPAACWASTMARLRAGFYSRELT
jgi:hypothetical protein